MRSCLALCVAVALIASCKVKTDDDMPGPSVPDLDDLDDVQDRLRDAATNLDDLEICPGYTVDELLQANSLSPQCRDALLSFLPEPQTTFEERLVAPGGARWADGELHVLLQGADGSGAALAADALAAIEVHVTVGGQENLLAEGEYTFAASAELPSDLLSIAVVNDYSASMLEGDLRDVEDVERLLFECMPPVHETEVIRFSTEVENVLPFSSDRDAIDGALAFDDGFERNTTALLDALGTAASDLGMRPRPVRLVVLSTDGRENASQAFDQMQVLAALDDGSVFVVALGALLADVDYLRELTDGRGVFFYTREFSALQSAAMPYLDSLKELVELHVPSEEPPSRVRLTLGELELDLSVQAQ